MTPIHPFRRDFGPREMHKVFCTECGNETEVPFLPTEGRPLFCKDCYLKLNKPRFDARGRIEDPPDFEFAGIVDSDGQPIKSNADIPSPIHLTVCDVNDELIAYFSAHPERMIDLSPRKFELLIAELLNRHGFEVEPTSCTRDGGFDLYAAKNFCFGRFLYLIECKRYRPPRKVGVVPVRMLYGVVQAKRANAGVIATTASFTADAQTFQDSVEHQLKLCDYVALQQWLADI